MSAKLRDEIAGVSIISLAKDFGTPVYVYNRAAIDSRVAQIKDFGTIRYALKACSNVAILSHMRELGVMVDCVSVGEIHRALRAGYQTGAVEPEIVYTCDIFDEEALEIVVEQNISVNTGSLDMIEQYGLKAPGKEITLRINPGFGHGHSQKTNTGGETSKHGIWIGQLEQALALASKYSLTVSGLHMHIGSGTDLEHLSQVCDTLKDTAIKIGSSITMISAGGGLPVPYRDSDEEIDLARYKGLWWKVRDDLEAEFGHGVRLETEPGRFLTAEAGNLIAEVRAVKEQGSKKFVLLDTGFTELARPIMYGAYHPISVCRASGDTDAETTEAVIAGPLCESGDVFTQQEGGFVETRVIPSVEIGDYLILENAGSYGVVMASNYNSRFLCPEVLIHNGHPTLIRRRQTIDDLLSLEFF